MRALPAVGTPCPVRTSRHPCPERHTEPHRHESTQRETHIVNVGRRLMLASDATRHTHHRHYAIDKDTEGSTHTSDGEYSSVRDGVECHERCRIARGMHDDTRTRPRAGRSTAPRTRSRSAALLPRDRGLPRHRRTPSRAVSHGLSACLPACLHVAGGSKWRTKNRFVESRARECVCERGGQQANNGERTVAQPDECRTHSSEEAHYRSISACPALLLSPR